MVCSNSSQHQVMDRLLRGLRTGVRVHAVEYIICHCHEEGINLQPIIQLRVLVLIIGSNLLVLDPFQLSAILAHGSSLVDLCRPHLDSSGIFQTLRDLIPL